MRPRIAGILRYFGNLFFDTAERIHPIDNQPSERFVPYVSEVPIADFQRAFDEN